MRIFKMDVRVVVHSFSRRWAKGAIRRKIIEGTENLGRSW